MAIDKNSELEVYVANKYRIEFQAQTEPDQKKLYEEYEKVKMVSKSIASKMKNDVDYIVASQMISLDIWSKKFVKDLTISEEELKKAYTDEKPDVLARFLLRNILVKDEANADTLLKIFKDTSNDALIVKFTELAQTKSEDHKTKLTEGKIGWLDQEKLEEPIKSALEGKIKNDIVKVEIPNLGWQVLFVEDFQPKRTATYEESIQYLDNLLRQKKLDEEIRKMTRSLGEATSDETKKVLSKAKEKITEEIKKVTTKKEEI